MNLDDHILLWNHVFIKVMDVRFQTMDKGEELPTYRLPASAFLYTVRGSARVWIIAFIGSNDSMCCMAERGCA